MTENQAATNVFERSVVKTSEKGLKGLATASGVLAVLWLWLSIMALASGGLSHLLVLPVSILGVFVFGWVCYWAMSRKANDEPALVADEAGIYDNVSPLTAGRIKWNDMERLWMTGPRWMRILCIRPNDVKAYLAGQNDFKSMMMRINLWLFKAPVAIMLNTLDTDEQKLWNDLQLTSHTKAEPADETPVPSHATLA